MQVIKYLFLLVVTIVCVTFSLSNRDAVMVDFFPLSYRAELPVFLIVFIAFFFGVLIGGFKSLMNILKLRRTTYATKKQVSKLQKELSTLKDKTEDLPVK